jgi:glycine betaine/choline ABC-type transport system substrate-binding protein
LALCFSERKTRKNVLIIGAKNRAESQILSEMMSILIEKNSDLKVIRKYNLEGAFISFNAMRANDLDIYPAFTGTALVSILKEKSISDPKESYLFVKREFERRFNIIWLKPFGFKNNYALMMLKKRARELNINNVSDLKKYKNLKFGFDPEFVAREEFKLLKEAYGMKFKFFKIIDHVLLYFSLDNKGIEVMNGFTTDPNILHYDLKILEDVKNSLPQYIAAPLIRKEILVKYPYLESIINKLAYAISDGDMQKLNYEVDYEGRSIKEVAREFLKVKGIL